MKDNLKSCPFCGGEGKLETMLYGGTAVSCQNTDCGFYGYNVETSMWNTRPNDAKKMIAEIELLTEALKISCRHQLIVEALSLPECDEMIEQYDDSDDQELMDSYIERAKQSIEGEE